MKTRSFTHCFSLLLAGVLAATTIAEAQMRTWTAADGRTLEAEFAGTVGAGVSAAVKLKLPDGSITNYPIANLSEADRLFVKGNLPTDPAALAAEIDKLVINKMKEAYYGLRDELAALP
ncbi:MAG: hypothetical protein AAF491_11985, partial [Verrucomicrobiota bacterium]